MNGLRIFNDAFNDAFSKTVLYYEEVTDLTTSPTITYGHGFLDDAWATLTSDYTLTLNGSTGAASVTSSHDLKLSISSYVADAYLSNNTALNLSTSVYKKALFRFKTEGAAKAKIIAVYSDSASQTLLESASSSMWKCQAVSLRADKMLDYLQFYCAEDAGAVYYDFILICKEQFTLPQYSRIEYSMRNRYSSSEIPSRIGRRKAWLGADETVIVIDGPVDDQRSSWLRPVDSNSKLDVVGAEVFADIHHNAYCEPWQWFESSRFSGKVTLESLDITEDAEAEFNFNYHVVFCEYRLSRGQSETYLERMGLV